MLDLRRVLAAAAKLEGAPGGCTYLSWRAVGRVALWLAEAVAQSHEGVQQHLSTAAQFMAAGRTTLLAHFVSNWRACGASVWCAPVEPTLAAVSLKEHAAAPISGTASEETPTSRRVCRGVKLHAPMCCVSARCSRLQLDKGKDALTRGTAQCYFVQRNRCWELGGEVSVQLHSAEQLLDIPVMLGE